MGAPAKTTEGIEVRGKHGCVRLILRSKRDLPSGGWYCEFHDQAGKRRNIRVKDIEGRPADKRRALGVLTGYLNQVADASYQSPSEQRTFEDLTHTFFSTLAGVRDFTRSDYEGMVRNHLAPYFGSMRLRTVTAETVEQWLAQMRTKRVGCTPHLPAGRPLAARTINKTLTLLSEMLGRAERYRWITANPCRSVDQLRRPPGYARRTIEQAVMTLQECDALIAAAGTYQFERLDDPKVPELEKIYIRRAAQRNRILIRLAIETGARQGELVGLTWDRVDLTAGRIKIDRTVRRRQWSDTKTESSGRTIDIGEALVSELRRWKLAALKPEAQWRGLVFPTLTGSGPVDPHNFTNRHWKRLLSRAGIARRVRWHDLRHTCASLMIAAGKSLLEVQAQLGHASATVTLGVYGHLVPGTRSPGVDVFRGLAAPPQDTPPGVAADTEAAATAG